MIYLACGSRHFKDGLTASLGILNRINELPSGGHLIHGDAQGADRWAAISAKKAGLKVTAYPADWGTHGDDCHCKDSGSKWCKEAGFRRNLLMLDQKPALVIAFWNGSSHGTKHTIKHAQERGIPVEVIRL